MATKYDLGWYGKLPTAGDFLQEGIQEDAIQSWSTWFKTGLLSWDLVHDNHHDPFCQAPVWNFVLPATLGVQRVQIGCLMPSRDRVGRAWPLLAVKGVPLKEWHPAQLNIAGDWFQELGTILYQAVRERHSVDWLDQAMRGIAALPLPDTERSDILDVLGYDHRPCTLAWADVASRFDPAQYTSYWWTNQSDNYPLSTHMHSGILTARLFAQLFHPTAGLRPGHHGFYPPMFD
ncbi:type VI secretion system-associated protein TagF [Erwinia piriflorinigrans]|uniref:Type VI secretion system-associated protein TagF n=1 Tax=Erwinia piriflorinigrans CFBP 5888 TaxID=1161919 RepID=V5Z839_9GAMM|nr:type VI secretion system-associated protein TagF [Erwinia piriflorinigrans]CCG87125.1 putative type VI secretion system-associated hypothetical protein [Erwinia piriflorinigrans CFBP 5888]